MKDDFHLPLESRRGAQQVGLVYRRGIGQWAEEGATENEPGLRERREVAKEAGGREKDKGEVSDRSNLDL